MTSTSPISRINLPLIALWLASAAAAVGGYLMMQGGNADQVELYTTQSGDYEVLFEAQSASTIGGFLVAVGALGLLLALAAHSVIRGRRVSVAPAAAAPTVRPVGVVPPRERAVSADSTDTDSFDPDVFDAEPADAELEASAPAKKAPAKAPRTKVK